MPVHHSVLTLSKLTPPQVVWIHREGLEYDRSISSSTLNHTMRFEVSMGVVP